MRIESYYRISPAAKRSKPQSEPLFADTMKEIQKQESDEKENKKGKLVTAREDGYIRQYLVRPDGSKVLLGETKQTFGEFIGNAESSVAQQPVNNLSSNSSQSTQDMMALLNFYAGAVITSPVNQQQLYALKD
ncbi:hypothetical protein [Paenibacillus popilliae]|uniref:Uncharacterized protein n=1 Tax=Paenibacillus popilliae TaxID=78057 RepID=A0ABY3AUQ0_PAEPP|nr:hypothetical protein [Paenibacillus sp. SDF0028]TQR46255.1 hypothetical protein C7Y44_00745 [Paenibacillus sp. SDF0028]